MTVAFLASPSPYGLFSVYRNLRTALVPHGVRLRWLAAGPIAAAAHADPDWAHEREHGEVVAATETDPEALGKALVRHLRESYNTVIVNPPQDPYAMNTVRYLPPEVGRVAILHASALGVFRLCRGIRDYTHRWVALCPRAHEELVARQGFAKEKVALIPNAIDLSRYTDLAPRPPGAALRILSFGRIDEKSKGVFWLPEILRCLGDLPVTLTVAGDGPDLPELRRRCQDLRGDRVRFVGVVPPARVPELAASHDVFLMPSRTEGFPFTIIEAMAGGCVPVVSLIPGVTDFIITPGRDGQLFPVGDTARAARHVAALAADPASRAAMADAAKSTVAGRFSLAGMGTAYKAVLDSIPSHSVRTPLDLDRWSYPREFTQPLAARLLSPRAKEFVRGLIEFSTARSKP